MSNIMLPPFFQRILLIASIVGATWLFHAWLAPVTQSVDGTEGLSLLQANHPGSAIITASLLILIAGVMAAVVAPLCTSMTSVFGITAGLSIAALQRGSIQQWLRQAESSSHYGIFAAEALLWVIFIGVLVSICLRFGSNFTPHDPRTDRTPLQPVEGDNKHSSPKNKKKQIGPDKLQSIFGLLVCIAVGLVLSHLLIRRPQDWQVLWGLGIGFGAGAIAANHFFPKAHTLLILVSPPLAAVLAYGWLALTSVPGDEVLSAMYQSRFWGFGLALPVHFASAGVAGAAFGLDWSHSLRQIKHSPIAKQ